ncbi:LON peptidase substrate-binding domain-containing protein [Pleomorphovibrio marinus]|uniref:LON peptidase substrate-binding domain-containing protein n=1 Tax=Pleomorphovibrio marinus TaxID=2164132 RepID=UPI000E0C6FD1|nr:LON peptidase substrate-binding domain-containing protein [Pleomorphovibrio marinus]
MEKSLALFPLKLVAFPGVKLNLHIFEPRYRQMIKDCVAVGENFGVCVFIDKLLMYGTEVRLVEISKTYQDGRMDIKTIGVQAFRILSFENPYKDKLYAVGKVSELQDDPIKDPMVFLKFKNLLSEFLKIIGDVEPVLEEDLFAYTYADKLGLSLEHELKLLLLRSENDRLEFLIRHMENALPIVRQMEMAREKIKLNGHFKYLDPLNF